MNLSISEDKKLNIFNDLKSANQAFNKIYRGDREDRQPIHTVYGGANLFKSNTTDVLGKIALKSLLLYAPNFIEFGKAFQLNDFEDFPSKYLTGNVFIIKYRYQKNLSNHLLLHRHNHLIRLV